MTNISPQLLKLYGEQKAKAVFNKLQQIDPDFNQIIQEIAYDYFWAREGLSIRDKSFVTVVAVIATEKAEQTRIHINGFLNSSGSIEELVALLNELKKIINTKVIEQGFSALAEVLRERQTPLLNSTINLSERDKYIAHFVAYVAQGELIKFKKCIKNYFVNELGHYDELKNILIHQIVYCGFPAVMNGFTVLREYMESNK